MEKTICTMTMHEKLTTHRKGEQCMGKCISTDIFLMTTVQLQHKVIANSGVLILPIHCSPLTFGL